MNINVKTIDCELGAVTVYTTDDYIIFIEFGTGDYDRIKSYFKEYLGDITIIDENCGIISQFELELSEYLAGNRKIFDVKYKLYGTEFRKKVWHELEKIPYGFTKSYGEIANAVGNPKAARAVGGANHNNPVSILVPCHRVIGSDKSLTGYGGGLDIKRRLLEREAQYMEHVGA